MKNSMAPLLGILLMILLTSSAWAIEIDEPGGIDLHGFISQGFLQSTDNNFFANTENGSFELKDTGISFSTDITARIRVGIQLMAYEMGDFGSDAIQINWANGDYSVNDWLGIKIGKMKLHHGLYNTGRDGDFLRTSILLPQSIYNEAWRSTVAGISGFEIYSSLPGGYLGRLSMNGQVGKVDINLDSGVATTTKEQLLENTIIYDPNDIQQDTAFVGRLLWETPFPGLSLNTTFWTVDLTMTGTAQSDYLSLDDDNSVYKTSAQSVTGSLEYSYGDFLLVSEYSICKYDFSLSSVFSKQKLETEGYYTSLAYRFTNWLETGYYYSVYYPNKDDKKGERFVVDHSAWLKDSCLSFRFDILDNWVFKLEGHLMNGTAVMMNNNNPDAQKKEDWTLFGAKATFSF
ncbi:MAG: hypothetical protein KKD44_23565 [Proteobacteria bacterium]|nr:hypothetical protein [Pseudomonadota bacterium]